MNVQSRLTPRDALEPVSPRARVAGLTVGGCLFLAGLTLLWAAWHALRCGLSGAAGQTICGRAMGIGGLVSMLGLGLVAAGAGVVWRTTRRLVDPEGPSGWVAGEGITIALAGVLIASLIPTRHCPAGYEMTAVFHWCRGISPDQFPVFITHPPSWMAWKLAVAATAIVLGIVVGRWRAFPGIAASFLTVGTMTAVTLLLADRTVGLPAI